jgi:hypothetical protein
MVAAVAGVRSLLGRWDPNELGESPSPGVEPATAKPEVEDVCPERGGGTTGE